MGLEVREKGLKEICNGSRILEKCEREFRNGFRIPGKGSERDLLWVRNPEEGLIERFLVESEFQRWCVR